MSFFDDKGTRESEARSAAESASGSITHRLTLDLSRAHDLAAMLASSRASKFIEISDLVAGMYLYAWDRLSAYWSEENRPKIEAILRTMCRISPERWNYWIQFYDAQRKRAEPDSGWEKLKAFGKQQPDQSSPVPSTSLRALFKEAAKASPFHDTKSRNVPILTMECVLLSIVRTSRSDIAQKMRETRVDVAQLEKIAFDPKRSPLR